MTPRTIMRFIVAELAVAKKQYSFHTFNEIVDEMVALYMPAESPYSPVWLKSHPA